MRCKIPGLTKSLLNSTLCRNSNWLSSYVVTPWLTTHSQVKLCWLLNLHSLSYKNRAVHPAFIYSVQQRGTHQYPNTRIYTGPTVKITSILTNNLDYFSFRGCILNRKLRICTRFSHWAGFRDTDTTYEHVSMETRSRHVRQSNYIADCLTGPIYSYCWVGPVWACYSL